MEELRKENTPDAIDNLKHEIGCYIAGRGTYPPLILMTQKQYFELLTTGKKLNLYTDILAKDRKIFEILIAVENEPETMLDIRGRVEQQLSKQVTEEPDIGFQNYEVPCCGYKASAKKYPVYYNPFNQCVQCHNCGHVYVPNAIPKENNK